LPINLAQACNAIGTLIGPIVAGFFILSSTSEANTSNTTLFIPYLVIASVVILLAVLFWKAEIPDLQNKDEAVVAAAGRPAQSRALLKRWHFTLAIAAQFFYVAAQIGVWGYFINYVTSPDMPNLPEWMTRLYPSGWTYFGFPQVNDASGHVISITTSPQAWHLTDFGASWAFSGGILCFLIGRLVGSMLLSFCSAHLTLAIYGLINSLLMVLIIVHVGWASVAALFLSCFFMSIMYPTIFALGIRGLGEHTKVGSSLIVMAIVGGAILPFAMGKMADLYGMRVSFSMPLVCFLCVMGSR
jgi:FHS family L-fucose permease-like MFS transporter